VKALEKAEVQKSQAGYEIQERGTQKLEKPPQVLEASRVLEVNVAHGSAFLVHTVDTSTLGLQSF